MVFLGGGGLVVRFFIFVLFVTVFVDIMRGVRGVGGRKSFILVLSFCSRGFIEIWGFV